MKIILKLTLANQLTLGYISTILTAIGPLIVVPIYFKQFGPEAWGLIAAVMLLQALLSSVEAGLSQGLSKEFAENSMNHEYSLSLRKTLVSAYIKFIAVAGVVYLLISPWISKFLFKKDELTLVSSIYLVCAFGLFVANFSGSIYKSLLIGRGHLALLSSITIFFSISRFAVGVFIAYTSPEPLNFLVSQLAINILELAVRYFVASRIVRENENKIWQKLDTRKSIAYAIKISLLVCVGVFVVNIDKLVVSAMLTLREFGEYAIATSLAIGVSQFLTPLCQAYLPKLIAVKNSKNSLKRTNRKFAIQVLVIVSSAWLVYAAIGYKLVEFWLHGSESTARIYPLVTLLLIGTTFNALSEIGYTNWLAFGATKYIAIKNITSIIVVAVLLPFFVTTYGLQGAAISWIASSGIVLLLTLYWLGTERGL